MVEEGMLVRVLAKLAKAGGFSILTSALISAVASIFYSPRDPRSSPVWRAYVEDFGFLACFAFWVSFILTVAIFLLQPGEGSLGGHASPQANDR